MNFRKQTSKKFQPTKLAAALLIAFAAAGQVVLNPATAQAANASVYVTPSSGSFAVGSTFAIQIRENSNNQMVNAVQAKLSYSGNLQFVSFHPEGTFFDVDAEKTAHNNTLTVARGATKPLTGDQNIIAVTFKVIGAGQATVAMLPGSALVSADSNKNIGDAFLGANYVLVAQPNPGPPGKPGTPGPPGRPAPIPTTYPIPAPGPGMPPNVSITPEPTPTTPEPQPIILPDESEIEVEQPSVIETTPSEDKTVEKVEYYINGKLTMTVNEPPYSYSVDTSKMRNGRYTLTTKTYYTDGNVESVDAALIVSNPLNAAQLMLQLQHYAWLVILLALVIGGLIWFKFFKNHGGGGDNFGDGYGSDYSGGAGDLPGAGTYGPPPPPGSSVIAPPGAPTSDPNGQNQQYPPNQYGQY